MNKFLEIFKKIKLPNFKKISFPSRGNAKFKRPSIGGIIFWVITLALAVVGFLAASNLATCWTMTNIPGVPPASCNVQVNPLGTPVFNAEGTPISVADLPTPVIAAPEVQLPQWDGASRVNILFIGLDYRDTVTNEGPPRSDSMILFTIDPATKTAGMLSIPRDLWVNIPGGFGYSRINTAYSSGEGNKLPGGGPGLAMKTVENLLGVPIHYFGQVDFSAFEEAIDAMGGLYICIPYKIRVDPIGDKKPQVLQPGCQTLWGFQILAFARQRHTQGGDVDRAKRQQLVIYALVNQIFSPQNFPHMVSIAPKVYGEAQKGLRTNMSFEEALKLGVLMSQISPENIKGGVIDDSMVTFENTSLGGQDAAVLKPITDKIRVLRDEIFSTTGPTSPMANGDPVTLMQQDGARVRLVNGTYNQGLEQRTANYLVGRGANVTEAIPVADRLYDQTVIILYTPKLYAYRFLITELGLTGRTQLIMKSDPASTADIEIRLGNDWAARLPPGY